MCMHARIVIILVLQKHAKLQLRLNLLFVSRMRTHKGTTTKFISVIRTT